MHIPERLLVPIYSVTESELEKVRDWAVAAPGVPCLVPRVQGWQTRVGKSPGRGKVCENVP
eukprot:1852663-Amphidinium_carterae.2